MAIEKNMSKSDSDFLTTTNDAQTDKQRFLQSLICWNFMLLIFAADLYQLFVAFIRINGGLTNKIKLNK